MSEQMELVNLEANLKKRRGKESDKRGSNNRGHREGQFRRQRSRSRSDSFHGRNRRRNDRSHSKEKGEFRERVNRSQKGKRNGNETENWKNVVIIKNMPTLNRISDIFDDIKIRAGDFKDIEINADNLMTKNSDYKIDLKIYFYDSDSCDRCVKGYNESVLDGSTLQCFRQGESK